MRLAGLKLRSPSFWEHCGRDGAGTPSFFFFLACLESLFDFFHDLPHVWDSHMLEIRAIRLL